jgi:hypothetical protein
MTPSKASICTQGLYENGSSKFRAERIIAGNKDLYVFLCSYSSSRALCWEVTATAFLNLALVRAEWLESRSGRFNL